MKVHVVTRQPKVADKIQTLLEGKDFEVETHSFPNGYTESSGPWAAIIDWNVISGKALKNLRGLDQSLVYQDQHSPDVEAMVLHQGFADYLHGELYAAPLCARVLRTDSSYKEIPVVYFKDLSLDTGRLILSVSKIDIKLLFSEMLIVKALIKAKGNTVSREWLVNVIQDEKSLKINDTRCIDSHIKRIRQKIHAEAPDRKPIKTLYKVGYYLD